MEQSNIEFYNEAHEALKEAFERGYRLGRNDGREGVFMDIPSLVKQFGDSLPTNTGDKWLNITTTKILKCFQQQ